MSKKTTATRWAIVVVSLVLTLLAITTAKAEFYFDSLYPTTAIVRKLIPETDEVITEDCNGNIWVFKGVEDWDIDDICSFIMYDNDTPETIYDDVIVSIKYSGCTNGLI